MNTCGEISIAAGLNGFLYGAAAYRAIKDAHCSRVAIAVGFGMAAVTLVAAASIYLMRQSFGMGSPERDTTTKLLGRVATYAVAAPAALGAIAILCVALWSLGGRASLTLATVNYG